MTFYYILLFFCGGLSVYFLRVLTIEYLVKYKKNIQEKVT